MAEEMIQTTCTMDCPDSCALEVLVNNGRIEQIRGGHDHPDTNGFICAKIGRFAQRVYHPSRVLHPMRRCGAKGAGAFEAISWDQALEEIAAAFKRIVATHGGEAILPYAYGGSNGLLGDNLVDDYFFARLGASRLGRTLCAAPSGEVAMGMYGKMPGVAFEDYARARCILIWGANPRASNIHLLPYIKRAKAGGAFVAAVDPRRTFSEQEVDLHLPLLPGTDLPLALAMVQFWQQRCLIDEKFLAAHARNVEPLLAAAARWPLKRAARVCGVSVSAIQQLAEAYAGRSPAVIRCGWGTERNRNGGQALAAIMAMPALLGKFGVRGGGYTMSNSGAARLDTAAILGEFSWNTRTINMSQLGKALTMEMQPPIKGLFVYNCNPLATAPNQRAVEQGMGREDLFTVVFEQVMTDTARFADILLPAVTFLEQREIKRSYGAYIAGGVRPAIAPRGQARSNEAVFAALGRAMGWTDPVFLRDTGDYMQLVAQNLTLHDRNGEIAPLLSGGRKRFDFPGQTPVQFATVFPKTTDGKIDLCPGCLGPSPYTFEVSKDSDYPLALISPATSKMISSTLGEFNYPRLTVTMHPRDAAARGIRAGERVRVFNRLGEVECHAELSERVRTGVVVIPKGAWRKASLNGYTSNALCPDHVNIVGGGACFNDARVEVQRIAN